MIQHTIQQMMLPLEPARKSRTTSRLLLLLLPLIKRRLQPVFHPFVTMMMMALLQNLHQLLVEVMQMKMRELCVRTLQEVTVVPLPLPVRTPLKPQTTPENRLRGKRKQPARQLEQWQPTKVTLSTSRQKPQDAQRRKSLEMGEDHLRRN